MKERKLRTAGLINVQMSRGRDTSVRSSRTLRHNQRSSNATKIAYAHKREKSACRDRQGQDRRQLCPMPSL